MSNPYIGEIRMFSGTFAPAGWAFCDGASLAIADYSPLFQLIGVTYGGDGISQFNVPDLRSRVPIGNVASMPIGMQGGREQVTLMTSQIPSHNHALVASSATGTAVVPTANVLASGPVNLYRKNASPAAHMTAKAISASGAAGSHPNIQPYLSINFIISLYGIYPVQN